ncbi:hypothetical protein MFLAVUS_000828 [Mucor flavus]|uniref:Dolichyl-diphosphooligosaccharide--protein glycosyltransferase subunit WBP1 n=1 Tax=Mucor flavus TaxID=439312 RepID=A0ABP9YKV8_9FUNG
MRGLYSLTALVVSCVTLLSSVVEAKSSTGNRVLVLLDSLAEKESYNQFWHQLQDRQFELVFKKADDSSIALLYFGESLYNHIIHFAPKTDKLSQHKALSNVQLVDFVKNGGNILAATGVDASDNVRALAAEFDIELDTETVFDHTNFDNEDHSLITTNEIIAPTTIIDAKSIEAPVLYTGTGLSVGKLPLSTAILTTGPDSFLADSYNKRTNAVGSITLVGSMQTRNNARVTFVGSLDLFSDKLIDASVKESKSGNQEFIAQLSQWTFQEKSVLKVVGHSHHKQNDTEQLDWYRVKDDIVYDVDIAEYKNDQWVPYKANDVQLEVIMLDPYIRTTLKQVPVQSGSFGRFEANLRLPDRYGVFTFKVNYKRSGLTYILAEDQVSIRPLRHNEYPRFLTAAYPYYASTGSMIVGFLVFSAIWLSTWGGKTSIRATKAKAN